MNGVGSQFTVRAGPVEGVGPDADLFDRSIRNDTSAPRHSESTYELINRRVGPLWEEMRTDLNQWFNNFPQDGREDLRRRFQESKSEQHVGAWWELYVHALLRRLNYRVSLHPSIPGTRRRPDFLAENDEETFYVEATHVRSGIVDEGRESDREDVIFDLVNQASSTDFTVSMELERVGVETPSASEIVRPLEQWLSTLSADDVEKEQSEGGSLPWLAISARDWVMTFEAVPISRPHRGQAERILGFYPGKTGFVNDIQKSRAALDRKKRRYGKPDRPMIIALLSDSWFFDDDDVGQCLFGSEAVQYRQNDPTFKPRLVRQRDGFWMSNRGPSGKGISAVLHADCLRPWSFRAVTPRLWINPWAQLELESHMGLPLGLADDDGMVRLEEGKVSSAGLFGGKRE